MPVPQLAVDAVQLWDMKQPLEAVRLGGAQADQRRAWANVFEILRKFPMPANDAGFEGKPRWTYSAAQFDSWCFKQKLGFAPAPAQPDLKVPPEAIAEFDAVRGMAFAILREGWQNVMARKWADDPGSKIAIQKT